MPADILLGLPSVQEPQVPIESVVQKEKVLREAFEKVRANLALVQRRQKGVYDKKLFLRVYSKGDLVYKLDESTKIGESKKLRPVLEGPYVVLEAITPSLYRLVNRRKTCVVHHDKLRICRSRGVPYWLRRKRSQLLGLTEVPEEVQLDPPALDGDLNISGLFEDVPDPGLAPGPVDEAENAYSSDSSDEGAVEPAPAPAPPPPVSPVRTRKGRVPRPPTWLTDYDTSR